MAQKYVPPKQKRIGQIIDSLFLLVLVYLSLFMPLLLNKPAAESEQAAAKTETPPTWEALGQNPTMRAQWEKLGYNPEKAKPIISNKFDYSIEPLSLIATIAVMVGYFLFVLRVSDREYKQVIAEKFGDSSR